MTDILAKVEQYLGGPLDAPAVVHHVRDVAPNKIMLCVSFALPEQVAFFGRLEGQPGAAGHVGGVGGLAAQAEVPAVHVVGGGGSKLEIGRAHV